MKRFSMIFMGVILLICCLTPQTIYALSVDPKPTNPLTQTPNLNGLTWGQDVFDHGDYGYGFVNASDSLIHQSPPLNQKYPPYKKRASWWDIIVGWFL
jgi:hypothetical protein